MSILSIKFLIFLIILIVVYYSIPTKYQWTVLLFGSFIFYSSQNWKWLFLISFTIFLTYFATRYLGRLNREIKEELGQITEKEIRKAKKALLLKKKKAVVAITLIINFGILFFFKTAYIWKEVPLLLPLGISFYTFQTSGYLIDVYRDKFAPETNLLKYALFVSYFPQILQGPINRYQQLSPQFFCGYRFQWRRVKLGIWLFLWGVFKKLVISDRTAFFVRTVLGEKIQDMPGSIIVLAIFLFNLQLYTDFSGGIDMVQGISQIFGIELAENFRRPFFSRTLAEYWRRWHISLGLWIKDYVFYPIAMSKLFAKFGKKVKVAFGSHIGKTLPGAVTSVITFVLIGLWHDITWCYVLYGLWHGIVLGLSNILEPILKSANQVLRIRTDVFSFRCLQRFRTWIIVSVGELFTLAGTLPVAHQMWKQILINFKGRAWILNVMNYGLDGKDWFVLLCAILVLASVSIKQEEGIKIRETLEKQNLWFQWLMTAGVFFVTIVFGVYGPGYDAAAFIYGGF